MKFNHGQLPRQEFHWTSFFVPDIAVHNIPCPGPPAPSPHARFKSLTLLLGQGIPTSQQKDF